MSENAGKKKMLVMLAPMSLAIGLAVGSAYAATDESEPVLTSGSGEGVVTGYGECWGAVGGTVGAPPCAPEDVDSDGDGVPDSRDRCPNTPKGAPVDADGCPLDSDGDGVPDYKDNCPGTPKGAKVDPKGCEIMADLTIQTTADHFDFDSAVLKPAMMTELDEAASQINASKGNEMLEIIGHTDSTGPEDYNQRLSERRAQAAADYLESKGVSPSRMVVKGAGESSPMADNATREGRSMNRRVELRTR